MSSKRKFAVCLLLFVVFVVLHGVLQYYAPWVFEDDPASSLPGGSELRFFLLAVNIVSLACTIVAGWLLRGDGIRWSKVRRARTEIARGTFETEERVDGTVQRLKKLGL